MADPISIKLSNTIAQYVRPGVSRNIKEEGLTLATTFEPLDHVMLLFCLAHDKDSEIKQIARRLFSQIPDNVIIAYLNSPGLQKGVRELIERVHGGRPIISSALLLAQALPATFIEPLLKPSSKEVAKTTVDEVKRVEESSIIDNAVNPLDLSLTETEESLAEEEEEVDTESEEFLSKYRMAQVMGIGEKIKMALTGDKEWRSLLIKDGNKLVSSGVVKNPRITDGEILTILKIGVQNDDIIRIICANKEWVKKYKIRKALIDCPKTPIASSLRFMAMLDIKDIAFYAKSKNISSVLSTQAKRLILSKKR